MSAEKKNNEVVLVTLEQPCTACLIACRLTEEIIEKVRKRDGDFPFRIIRLKHIREIKDVEGLEVEKFPAVIIDGEQVTAGTFPNPEMLKYYIYGEES
ncbi:thioredoxin family protein [Christensenella tenuis]|jgi:hypothetical protein|uniref:Thioredoxin family protein n=1 Tax=Christensenella tenuis TaxID=2763033 RepID=A0ABR7EF47_9FIRM|nr:thioredoxin family protein [Christensenella tenuis]MBC5648278.1 thioredoxin family protein [Christensenella tenuis]